MERHRLETGNLQRRTRNRLVLNIPLDIDKFKSENDGLMSKRFCFIKPKLFRINVQYIYIYIKQVT